MILEKKEAYKAIILFGSVSLAGDIIYEGARGITPSFLEFLGASAFIVGITFGLSEFINFTLRLISGMLADKTRSYWQLYAVGYLLIISIPLIGFTRILWLAIILILIERIAKAFRSPARDTLLSIISRGIGAGKTFGLHELMDQIGAIIGPAFLGIILLITSNYTLAFSSLFIPYIALLILVVNIFSKLKNKTEKIMGEVIPRQISLKELVSEMPLSFKTYTIAVTINTIGLLHWSLILYRTTIITSGWIAAFLYVLIQGTDAVSAPISGYLYDKYGKIVLTIPFILSIIPTILTLLGGLEKLILAGAFFGIVYGMQESIYRAAVSDLVPLDKRGTAYGIFNAFYGLGFLLSGTIYGWIIQVNLTNIGIMYGIIIQAIALYLLTKIKSVK